MGIVDPSTASFSPYNNKKPSILAHLSSSNINQYERRFEQAAAAAAATLMTMLFLTTGIATSYGNNKFTVLLHLLRDNHISCSSIQGASHNTRICVPTISVCDTRINLNYNTTVAIDLTRIIAINSSWDMTMGIHGIQTTITAALGTGVSTTSQLHAIAAATLAPAFGLQARTRFCGLGDWCIGLVYPWHSNYKRCFV
eukprot:jgi/Psemu1/31014/gm1.31014_g